ncbi:ATP-binding protein [Flammeovirga sp. SubArs3]|uniref:sensor histidine kinase n=1 Tax=Flammeovirga sp. SubArs3 TaxID=2995316 RepID=UPI00248CAB3B|nr:ATP-binding protein [Flammeovirga sp. SubArs3]
MEPFDIYHLFDKLSIAIFVLRLTNAEKREFLIEMANEENKKACGVDVKQFVGMSLRESFPGIYDIGLPEGYYKCVSEQIVIDLGEFDYGEHGVPVQTYVIKATPLSSDQLMISYENVSQLKRIERELLQKNQDLIETNKSLEEFAYITSHDLQEPLNTISSFVNILKSRYFEKFDNTGRRCLDYIEKSSIRLSNMIQGILSHSRLGSNATITDIDLNIIVADIKEDLMKALHEKCATINSDNLPTLKGDAIGLRVLFQNLIENGLKYQKEGNDPEIKIQVEESENGGYLFSISDNGIGIEEKYKKKIFQVFQRLHDDTTYKGSGLGLANCQKIVNKSGGKLWVESIVGQGSTFYFTLPNNLK